MFLKLVCRHRWDNLSLGYTESRGDPLLLAEISKMYESVPSEGPFAPIVCAPQEGVLLAMQAMFGSSGGTIVSMSPTYQSLHEIARSLGCDVLNWAPELNEQGLPVGYSLEALKCIVNGHKAKGGSVDAIIVNFPHNPTGSILTKQELNELVELCRENDAFFFCDEM